MMGKECFKCHTTKPLSEFYRHPMMADGHLGKCKECNKKDVQENYAKRRKQYSDYDARRRQNPERKADQAASLKRHNERHPDRAAARIAVQNAVKSGRLKKTPCVRCGTTVRVQGHHHDYSKPLDVTWECFKCHREADHGQIVTRPDW